MRIPKTLKIGGMVYNVVIDAKAGDRGCMGITLPAKEKIHLDKENSQQRHEQTLLHEIMHVVFFESGLNSRYTDDKQQEELVNALSSGMYQALRDNNLLK